MTPEEQAIPKMPSKLWAGNNEDAWFAGIEEGIRIGRKEVIMDEGMKLLTYGMIGSILTAAFFFMWMMVL